ncbi:MAG: hypothetical protein M0P57_14570 [Syntrophales bacterium]|jgi:hypothetical protein|nr:hypothetical protein [Syntrophales bacterium]
MKSNAYFDELTRIGREWEEKHEAHKARKQEIIDTLGWDSEELKAWYAEEEQMKFPYSQGACKAYRAWRYSTGDEVQMDDFCWEGEETHDFIDTLRRAGIETFVLTNQSTGLMTNLHGFAAEGCEMLGLCTITKKDNRWGEETEEQIPGIRFKVN